MKKAIFIISIVSIFSITFTACQTGKWKEENTRCEYCVDFSVRYSANCNWEEDKQYPTKSVFRSLSECEAFCELNYVNTVKYEASYFESNRVIGIELPTTDGAQKFAVNSVDFQNDKLTINISRVPIPSDVSGAAVMGEYIIFVGLSADYVTSYDSIILNINND